MKRYSRIDQIPRGHATKDIAPGCLVLEGGAFRGLYTSGACDALMLAGLNFESTLGVSAGALNAISYVSGQIGRSGRANLEHRLDKDYVGLKPLLSNGSVIGFDYLFGPMSELEPLDQESFFNPNRRFFVAATNCDTGELEVFEKNENASDTQYIYQAIRASSSMPYLSKMIEINGHRYLDGGCHTKIPFQWAIDQGYEKIVVIRTRPRSYRKNIRKIDQHIPSIIYRNYPQFAQKLAAMNLKYNQDCEQMERLEKEGRIFVIAPSKPVTVSRLESDLQKLGELYEMGLFDTQNAIHKLKEYLS